MAPGPWPAVKTEVRKLTFLRGLDAHQLDLSGLPAERAKTSEEKLALAEEILPVLADPAVGDDQVGGLLRDRIGMSRLRAALAEPATARLPRDHGHLGLIEGSYSFRRPAGPGGESWRRAVSWGSRRQVRSRRRCRPS